MKERNIKFFLEKYHSKVKLDSMPLLGVTILCLNLFISNFKLRIAILSLSIKRVINRLKPNSNNLYDCLMDRMALLYIRINSILLGMLIKA